MHKLSSSSLKSSSLSLGFNVNRNTRTQTWERRKIQGRKKIQMEWRKKSKEQVSTWLLLMKIFQFSFSFFHSADLPCFDRQWEKFEALPYLRNSQPKARRKFQVEKFPSFLSKSIRNGNQFKLEHNPSHFVSVHYVKVTFWQLMRMNFYCCSYKINANAQIITSVVINFTDSNKVLIIYNEKWEILFI